MRILNVANVSKEHIRIFHIPFITYIKEQGHIVDVAMAELVVKFANDAKLRKDIIIQAQIDIEKYDIKNVLKELETIIC